MQSTNFDEFSQDYKSLLDRSVACSGESSEYFAEYKASYVARRLGQGFQGKILDYGCGIGLLSGYLSKHLPQAIIHGYDVSEQSIGEIAPGLREQGLFSSSLERMDSDYHAVVISNVMHHIPPAERQSTICGLAKRTRVAGKVFIFEHNPWNPLTRWVVKHCPFDKDAVLLRPKETAAYLRSANVPVSRRDYVVFFPRVLGKLRWLEPLLAWLPFGTQYALVAER